MADEEFLAELAEKTTSVTVKEFTPEGVRLSYNMQGTVRGQYDAAHNETVDVLLKPDGTSEFEVRGIDQTAEGDIVLITARGTGRQVSPTSGLAEGELTFQTASAKLAWLNSAKGRFEGTFNTLTGEFMAKAFARR